MQRCIELAENGLGNVAPNPMTGCVIVHDAKVVGEGFHQHFGEAHAEVNAINNVVEKHGEEILKNCTLYVNLEPCVHQGKTPPCADLIIEKKIPEVVIGRIDPYEKVNGRGIQKLKDNGVKITVGILENECMELNKRFITFHTKRRPYIILKYAQSSDGFIAGKEQWISNETSRKLVHKWRSEEQAILVGSNTVLKDNPTLTVRDWRGKNPLRIVLGKRQLPGDLNVFNDKAETLQFKDDLSALMKELYNRKILSLIVEGGGEVLQSFIDAGLWDEARIFISNKVFGEGVKAPQMTGYKDKQTDNIDTDELLLIHA